MNSLLGPDPGLVMVVHGRRLRLEGLQGLAGALADLKRGKDLRG